MNGGDVKRAIAALDVDDGLAQKLVARFQGGDREAFADLYRLYLDRVYSYMRLMLKDHYEAEDATQSVFMKALEAMPRYQPRRPFAAWLMTIVRNVALDQLRANGREQPMDSAELDRRIEEQQLQGAEEEPDAIGWITDSDLLFFVKRLPQPQRQVLFLRYLLDMPGAEIARVLKRSHTDVRSLQHRALRFLEERLRALGKGPPEELEEKARERPEDEASMKAPVRFAPVIRSRRYSLM